MWNFYINGILIEKNYKKGKEYYEKSIYYGNINSIKKLSDLYRKVETDFMNINK